MAVLDWVVLKLCRFLEWMFNSTSYRRPLAGQLYGDTLPTSPVASTYAGFPTDMDDWSCAQLRNYYEANKAALGKDRALDIIKIDWGNLSDLSYNTPGFVCKYDCDFIRYFRTEGVDFSSIVSSAACGANNLVNSAENVTEVVKDASGSSLLRIGLIVGGGLLAYKYFSK